MSTRTGIGVPRERKPREGRVALLPDACAQLVERGYPVFLETGAGLPSGYPDAAYAAVGVQVLPSAEALWAHSRIVVKVKEPIPEEYPYLRAEHTLFCYLHLAALPDLTQELLRSGITAIGFEIVREHLELPLLKPMSEIAGTLSAQIGARLLHATEGGRGVLLGGITGAARGQVTVLGAGSAGSKAVEMAAAMGAHVTVFDTVDEKLVRLSAISGNVRGYLADNAQLRRVLTETDLLIGAVLLPGREAPKLVSESMVQGMPEGSVIIDISVDQGGCIETIHPTTYDAPTYVRHGVLHFGVTNMPGAVPRTASQALSAVIAPWVQRLAGDHWREDAPALRKAIYTEAGEIRYEGLE